MEQLFFGFPVLNIGEKNVLYSPYSVQFLDLPSGFDECIDKQKLISLGLYNIRSQVAQESVLTLVVSNRCNLACTYCYENAGQPKSTGMDKEVAITALDYIAKKTDGRLRVLLHGGEPTLEMPIVRAIWKHINERYYDRKPIIHLITNGVFTQEVARELLEMKISLTISYDGLEEIQGQQRSLSDGRNSAPIVEDNIRFFASNCAPIQILSIITEGTIKKMQDIVRNVSRFGITRLRIEPLISYGRAKHCPLTPPDGEKFAEQFLKCMPLAAKCGIRLVNSSIMNLVVPQERYCNCSLGNNMTVGVDGTVLMCHEVNDANETERMLRTVGSYDSIRRTFNICPEKINYYERITCKENNAACADCFAALICGGGCPTRNMTITGIVGSLDDNLCKMRKGIIKGVLTRMYLSRKEG